MYLRSFINPTVTSRQSAASALQTASKNELAILFMTVDCTIGSDDMLPVIKLVKRGWTLQGSIKGNGIGGLEYDKRNN